MPGYCSAQLVSCCPRTRWSSRRTWSGLREVARELESEGLRWGPRLRGRDAAFGFADAYFYSTLLNGQFADAAEETKTVQSAARQERSDRYRRPG
ncbi:hypothetical protein F4679DRAFT_583559 [Xylaria curta]|nr:hypothetical protein F4679DRAFT_583559 [Xylaria curta]